MTIISSTLFLPNYPFRKISEPLAKAFQTHASSELINVPLKLLECYLQLIEAELSYVHLSSRSCEPIIIGFVGTLRSRTLADSKEPVRIRWARRFVETLTSLRDEIPGMPNFDYLMADLEEGKELWDSQQKKLNPLALRYWNGWQVDSLKGVPSFLALGELWHSHGPEFTEEYYRTWKTFSAKQARCNTTLCNKLASYLSKNSLEWPTTTFQNPENIKSFFLHFMKEHFLTAYRENLNIPTQIKTWNRFISNCEEAFIQSGVWATPFGDGLPRPIRPKQHRAQTRVSVSDEGVEIHEKLITRVPLEITDNEAIEILFKSIHKDIETVKSWATEQANELYSRVQLRILATTRINSSEIKPRKGWQRRSYDHESICAIFQSNGFPSSRMDFEHQYGYTILSADVANILGLPAAGTLYPYQCLLVAEHNEITESFLKNFRLYDDKGRRSGFVKTDTGYQLVGFKDRRGGKLSEQKIQLNANSTKRIFEVIKITAPLRKYLKGIGDSRWKELFLTCGKGFGHPRSAVIPTWNKALFDKHTRIFERLAQQFSNHTSLRGTELKNFLSRVTLSSLRASCGVEVYLKTQSVEAMSKALGHANHDCLQLSHYLPESILAFFQARWIRIFQRGLICDAMKDSSFLIEAADFETMEELNLFLKNHALKDIPDHLVNPENTQTTEPYSANQYSEVYISVDPGIMTALVSLEKAVATAERPEEVTGVARYWADLTKAVVAEIRRDNDALLKDHLYVAEQRCNPRRMEKLIYEC